MLARWETTIREGKQDGVEEMTAVNKPVIKAQEAEERKREKAEQARKEAERHLEKANEELDKARTKL